MKRSLTKGKTAYILIRSILLLLDTLIFLYFSFWILLGIVDKYPGFLIVVVGLIFIGIAIIFCVDIVRDILSLKSKNVRQSDVLYAAFIFALLISTFGIAYWSYAPQWSEGVEHTPIFTKGESGREYRIPSLLILPSDVVLAFAESRTQAYMDWGNIDIVMKKSIDGGETWGTLQVIVDNGTRTAGNPCPVYNNLTGIIHLIYNIDNKLVFERTSSNAGNSWGLPRHLTDEVGLDIDWNTDRFDYQHGTGPGIGIQMSTGRLIIPCYYFDNSKGVHVIYSDDNGTTWEKGANLKVGGECQAVELLNGSLYVNARSQGNLYRYIATSDDGGETWNTWSEELALPDLGCMASIIRYTRAGPYQNALLFTNPYSSIRQNLTLQVSIDDGENWDIVTVLFEGSSAYSQLGELSDGTVCFVAEAGPKDYRDCIQFCTYTLY